MRIDKATAAVVTGGASGLGAATAQALAQAGAHVTVLDMNEEAGQARAKELGGAFHRTDVSDPASVAEAVAAVREAGRGLHVVVNCAGIATAAKTVSRGEAHDPAMFARTIGVNLIGTFNVSSQCAALMALNDPVTESGERGVIVATASVAAYDGQVGQIAYSASKGGVVGMTLPMARDLAQHGIRVVTIAPGIFMTPMMEGMSEEIQQSLAGQVPFPSRLGRTDEYAALARHIVENEMLNGEVIRLDGAIRMAPR